MRPFPRHPLSSSRTTAARRALAAAAVVASAAALSACGNQDRSPMGDHDGMMSPRPSASASTTSAPSATTASPGPQTPVAGAHNQADVDFAVGMVPHHEQALVMADMALAHGRTEDFLALAKAIKAAQKPEIDLMSAWLVSWGTDVPDAGAHGAHGMGMMSQQDLDDLGQMRGSGFEGMWLRMMIDHHEGAIEMSRTELTEGSSPEAKKLAASIIKSQSAEITQMKAMLAERAN
jgi:uncharacterized protein (DUF305 family)